MDILARKGVLAEEKADMIVLWKFEDAKGGHGAYAAVDKALEGWVKTVSEEDQFSGKEGEVLSTRSAGMIASKRIFVVGLGKKKELSEEKLRRAGAAILKKAKGLKINTVAIDALSEGKLTQKLATKALVEGMRLSDYQFAKYKKAVESTVEEIVFIATDANGAKQAQAGLEIGEWHAKGTNFARDLVNLPAEHLKPEDMVEVAKKLARGKSEIRVKVYDRDDLEEMGAGGILGIGQGSDHEPYLVHMTYTPKKTAKKKVALIGKAITYDTGGYSLKPSSAMLGMKVDMAGAAAVLGAFSVLADSGINAEVHGIFAPCENMVSGRAIRPGDVVKTMKGTTIEILNTDAEGRVTMADALYHATKFEPDFMIDLATLTGACMVALGDEISGVMSNDAKLAQKVIAAGAEAGEKMWELPLDPSFKKAIKSPIADINNTGARYAGASMAGTFLEEFVEKRPWVHIDIAGPSSRDSGNGYLDKGGTGVGVRTLLTLLRSI